MKIIHTNIAGVDIVEASSLRDERGRFTRIFCDSELSEVMGGRRIVQINQSLTNKTGTIRGLHFQYPPHAEMKLVRCLKGRIFDIAVDIRKGSRTFLKWHAEELTPDNARMMVVPEGCAHGFQVLEENSEVLYLHTASYAAEYEGGLRFDDPELEIQWPLHSTDLSVRDLKHPMIDADFQGIML